MNKIDKLDKELEKAREKAAEWQAKIRELEKQKQEEENSQIVQAVRSLKLTPAQLMAFLNDPKNSLTASGHTDPKPKAPERRTQPMKKTKFRRLAAMAASLLCCLIFTVPAYAQSNEPQPGDSSLPGGNRSRAGNPEPLYPGRDGNRGGQRHRRGWKGVLHHHHSRRERVLSGDRQTENQRERLFPQYRYHRRPSASCRTG